MAAWQKTLNVEVILISEFRKRITPVFFGKSDSSESEIKIPSIFRVGYQADRPPDCLDFISKTSISLDIWVTQIVFFIQTTIPRVESNIYISSCGDGLFAKLIQCYILSTCGNAFLKTDSFVGRHNNANNVH